MSAAARHRRSHGGAHQPELGGSVVGRVHHSHLVGSAQSRCGASAAAGQVGYRRWDPRSRAATGATRLRHVRQYPQTLTFLIAFLLYNDAIQTVLAVATQFANDELKIPVSQLTLAILMAQFVGFFRRHWRSNGSPRRQRQARRGG